MAQVQKCDVCGVLADTGGSGAPKHPHSPIIGGGCQHLVGWARIERFVEMDLSSSPYMPTFLSYPMPPGPRGPMPPPAYMSISHESKDICPACLKKVDDALKPVRHLSAVPPVDS